MRKTLCAAVALVTWALGIPVAAAAATPGAAPQVATTASVATITLSGHGDGHGIGMGQYGAYGYALAGEPSSWILAHYYGGTKLATTSVATVNVRLSELAGAATVVFIPPAGGTTVNNHLYSTPVRVNGSTATPDAGATCPGPHPAGDTVVCSGSFSRPYQGSFTVSGGNTIINVSLQDYVAGVVPSEMPASWGTSGGEAALEAQAVAARSYALADGATSSTGICDTESCQVYGGDVVGTLAAPYAAAVTNAVGATDGQVLECGTDAACGSPTSVALTEYSSSTGGYTAGGLFPAVVDAGDATLSNPNHSWSRTLAGATISGAFPQIGAFDAIGFDARNGLGDLGGRVESLTLNGSAGSVTISGSTFAGAVGLPSNWFGVADAITGPRGGDNGYWIVGSDGSVWPFGAAPALGSMGGRPLNAPIVGMAVTTDQGGYWEAAADGGIFTFGDARFYGSMGGSHLNQPIVGIAPTPDGHGYWEVAADGGIFTFGDARFYGSMGGSHLNQPIVGIAPTPDGHGYWEVAADGGIFTFGDARFYGSTGAIRLNQPIVGMVATAGAGGYWLVARDGGVFTFGNAPFLGSLPGDGISDTIKGLTPTADGGGYLVVGASGGVYDFGDAPFFGNLTDPAGTAIAIAGHRG